MTVTAAPKPARHLFDHGIAADAQRLARQFGWQVAIAEVPGDADQRGGFGGADFGERFGRSDDLDDAPVFELEPIAAAQQHRLVEIEQEIETAHALHRHPPAMAFVVVEHYGIGGFAGPAAGGDDGRGAQHGRGSERRSLIGRAGERGNRPRTSRGSRLTRRQTLSKCHFGI